MKKLFTLLTLIALSSVFVSAQDIILKRDGSEIKAKVLEITDQQIKYKDFDFQNGPTRNINISEVFMITYQNGQKEVFKQTTTVPPPTIVTPKDLKTDFYNIGSDDDDMLEFFRKNNFTETYNDFASACRQRATGKGLLSSGITSTLAGLGFMVWGLVSYDYYYMAYLGYAFIGAGEVLTIVSIPVSASAGARKKHIKNDFARTQFGSDDYSYQPKLNFGLNTNGVGFTLHF